MADKRIPGDRVVSRNEVASIYGISAQRVGQWAKEGCPRRSDGSFSLSAAVRWREAWWQSSTSGDSVNLERYRKARADREEFELAIKRGQFLPASEVGAFMADRVTAARTAMQSLGQALAPALVGMDAQATRRLIDDRCRQVCDELAREGLAALVDDGTIGKNEDAD